MRKAGVSTLKILGFLGLWTAFTAAVVMSAVAFSGEGLYAIRSVRVGVEIALMFAVVAPLVIMARFVDKRALTTIGFGPSRLLDVLSGAAIGALILAAPLAVLVALGAARLEPDWADFSAGALAIGLFVCFVNVVTQQVLVRSYIFQELWAKYGAWLATGVTTAIFVALHAGPISQGTLGLIAGTNILVASLMMSLAYVRTGELWLPIGIHFGWNGLQGPALNINVTGNELAFGHWRVFEFAGDPLLTGGSLGVEGGLVGLIGPVLGLAIVAFAFRQQPPPSFVSATK